MAAKQKSTGDATVTVVITNWNGRDLLKTCLPTVLDQDLEDDFEIIVVDNASTDDSVELVREQFPSVRVIEASDNNYAAGNNLGVESSSSEFVALLNTDTRVERTWLSELVKCAHKDKRIGAVGSLILFTDGKINSIGIDLCHGYHWSDRGFGRGREHVEALSVGEVYGLSGCAALYRRACWQDVGGLDEDFHMYYEDVDMSLRCRRNGWQLAVCPDSIVHHEYNASVFRADKDSRESDASGWQATPLKDRLGERNRLFVVARHYADELPELLGQSRFFLEADEPELVQGLRLALKKWELPGLDPTMLGQCEAMLLGARAGIRELERWRSRSQQLEEEVTSLETKLVAVREGYEQQISSNRQEITAGRASYEARIADLKADKALANETYQDQIASLKADMLRATEAYETQIAHGADALADARKAYEAEIEHREGVIADLKRLLDEREPPG